MCNLNALIERRTAIEQQLAELGFRIEPSLSSLDSETDLDALFHLESGELVDPPDAQTASLMLDWSALSSEISATQHALACGWSSLDQYLAHQAVLDARSNALVALKAYQETDEARLARQATGAHLVIPPSIEKRLLMITTPAVSTASGVTLAPGADFLSGATTVRGQLRITTGFSCNALLLDESRSEWSFKDLLEAMNSESIVGQVAAAGDIADVFIGQVWLGSTEV